MRRGQIWGGRATILALPVILAGCASTPRDASLPLQDPNEHVNRQMLTDMLAITGNEILNDFLTESR